MYSDLRCKDVINIKDCRKLGRICDMEFDECQGCICKIYVPGSCGLLGIFRGETQLAIPWKSICQIGEDIILVDIGCQ